jgi:hypothetical protein
VQRFLYGEGTGTVAKAGYGESPINVFWRQDVAKVCMTYADEEDPVVFEIAHTDLCFFYDFDIAIVALANSSDTACP